MKISARNQIEGTIKSITKGAVNGIVALEANGSVLKGTVSLAAIEELGLEEGKAATAIVKATEVMVATGDLKLSARNKLAGTVGKIEKGAVNAIVRINIAGGNAISATISNEAVEELGLAEGGEAVAVIKATSVMFGA